MEYRLGNSKHIVELGKTDAITCPNCKLPVSFPIYKNGEFRIIPLVAKSVYFTVCPECKVIFSLPRENGNAFEKGKKNSVKTIDFDQLEEFKI